MAPWRIAYSVNVFPKISETFIANEIAAMRRRGVDILILSHARPGEGLRHPIVDEAGLLDCTHYDNDRFLPALERFRPDLIHAHFATRPTEWARTWANHFSIPYTFTAHGYDVYSRPPHDFGTRVESSAAFITVSQRNAEHIHDRFGVDRNRINVVPCGVDIRRFRPRTAATAARPLIVCVARLHPAKNLPVLLRACSLLQRSGLQFRCVVIGEGDARPELEALRRDLGLSRCVRFIGARNQRTVRRWWQLAAVGVLTSEREGMPVSLMEAMACGTPVVAPRVGGIPEMINDGINGYVTEPGDPRSTAAALAAVLRDPAHASALGSAARSSVERNFSLERQVGRMLDIWSRILRQRDGV